MDVCCDLLKWLASLAIGFSTRFSGPVLAVSAVVVVIAGIALMQLERGFLPPFNEGSIQVNALLAPGTSLETSNQIAQGGRAAIVAVARRQDAGTTNRSSRTR